jgi:CO/xanthine dehydrogenase Mo-binding subunit
MFKGGMVLNPSLLSYKVPSALEIPEIEPIVVEHPHPEGPYGAKGVGETTNVPHRRDRERDLQRLAFASRTADHAG